MRQVVFLHGRDSGPRGRKSQLFAGLCREAGWEFLAPDMRATRDPDERFGMLTSQVLPAAERRLLAGSSMGAYVAVTGSAAIRPDRLLLLAPALYLPGYRNQDPVPYAGRTVVVHGWQDPLIPAASAWRFAERHAAELHLVADGHDLARSLPLLSFLFRHLLMEMG